jgi:L-alanine-DL-glutamate epimerase-like enolase superfamily enzyme
LLTLLIFWRLVKTKQSPVEAAVTRIAKIDTFLIRYPDPNDFNFDRQTVVLRAETNDGITGWGEAIAMWPEACRAVQLLIADGLKPILMGENVLATEARWEQMRRHTWWYGEGGLASLAISAIDMALWDIRGKIEGQPLYQLFGGLKKDRLPACASSHVNKATLEECVAEVAGFFEQGFRSCKLGFAKKGKSSIGKNLDKDIEFIKVLRGELGPKAEILVDAGNGVEWDVETAINGANQMLGLGVGWLEEPLYPTHDSEYRQLKAATKLPIASGEREFTVAGYRRLMESSSIDIIGVDPARAEGVTSFAKIDALAGQFHKPSTPMRGARPLPLLLRCTCRWLQRTLACSSLNRLRWSYSRTWSPNQSGIAMAGPIPWIVPDLASTFARMSSKSSPFTAAKSRMRTA